jgi:DNA mismatch repair ATPase MutS
MTELLARIERQTFTSSRLADLHARIAAGGVPPSRLIARLNRYIAARDSLRNEFVRPFALLLLVRSQASVAIDRWHAAYRGTLAEWLVAVSEIEALASFATYSYEHPADPFPSVRKGEPRFDADGLVHPLLPASAAVANDVHLGDPAPSVLVVSGSNMSGKSTLLRAIGLNTVLAQAGGCVCARRMRLPPCELQTSIRVQDSLELGLSYFMAALARLKGVVDAAEKPRDGRILLYLLDEILQGTNSAERSIAVRAVARHLLDAGAIGAMTTHDLNVAGEEPLKSSAVLVHFTESVDEQGHMGFDYRLREGIATSRNALRLMQMIGIDLKEA